MADGLQTSLSLENPSGLANPEEAVSRQAPTDQQQQLVDQVPTVKVEETTPRQEDDPEARKAKSMSQKVREKTKGSRSSLFTRTHSRTHTSRSSSRSLREKLAEAEFELQQQIIYQESQKQMLQLEHQKFTQELAHQKAMRALEDEIQKEEQRKEVSSAKVKLETLRKYANDQELGSDDPGDEDPLKVIGDKVGDRMVSGIGRCQDYVNALMRENDMERLQPTVAKKHYETTLEPKLSHQRELQFPSHRRADMTELARKQPEVRNATTNHESHAEGLPTVSTNSASADSRILDLLLEQSAPDIVIDKFSGDPLDFRMFRTVFENEVVPKVKSDHGKLNRLLNLTKGTLAHDIIMPYTYVEEGNGYDQAMEKLIDEFERDQVLINSYYKKVRETGPALDGPKLQKFYLWLKKVHFGLRNSDFKTELDTCENLRRLATRIPFHLQRRWNRKDTEMTEYQKVKPRFTDFLTFLEKEAKVLNNPTYSLDKMREDGGSDNKRRGGSSSGKTGGSYTHSGQTPEELRALATRVEQQGQTRTQSGQSIACTFCEAKTHKLEDCSNFRKIALEKRKEFIMKNRLCFGCLQPCYGTHTARTCTKRLNCSICARRHATCFHNEQPWKKEEPSAEPVKNVSKPVAELSAAATSATAADEELSTAATSATSAPTTTGESRATALNFVLAEFDTGNPGETIRTYCLVDSLSNGSFITNDLAKRLKSPDTKFENLKLKTLSSDETARRKFITNLTLRGVLTQDTSCKVKKLCCVESLPLDHRDVMFRQEAEGWSHVKHLAAGIPEYDSSIPFGILLGNDTPRAIEPHGFVRGKGESPYAVKYLFGWNVAGPKVSGKAMSLVQAATGLYFLDEKNQSKTDSDAEIRQMFRKMYEQDFLDFRPHESASIEDQKFLEHALKNTRFVDGNFEIPLLFRNDGEVPDNREEARTQALQFRNRLKKGPKVEFEKVVNFMNDMEKKGHSEKARTSPPPGKRYYITYHSVKHPKKPDKVRLVFNCAKKTKKEQVSLNDLLISGPDLTNKLVGVLARWREEEEAFVADIQEMFYQTKIPADQRAYLRYFWWDNEDLEGEPIEMQMTVHCFGATSSPAFANFTLKRCAEDFGEAFPPQAAETLRRNFYVDDLCRSVCDVETGRSLASDVMKLCAAGGYNLTKFAATDPDILLDIPVENRGVSNVVDRVLGASWVIRNDSLHFEIELKDRPPTKRGLLASLSSVYDPLGLVSPFLLDGRRQLQSLSASKLGWDEPVPEKQLQRWMTWYKNLGHLEKLEIRRSYKPKGFGRSVSNELHVFADACEYGYGCAVYIRLENADHEIATSLVMGKSRVVPLKGETIARSELVAAVLASECGATMKDELTYENLSVRYHTDSEIVLAFLNNELKRFKTFVSNRVRRVRDYTDIETWSYVRSAENAADDASRGLDAAKVTSEHRWFWGPESLLKPKEQWSCAEPKEVDLSINPEVKPGDVTVCALKVSETDKNPVLQMVHKFSDWSKMKRVIARLMKFCSLSKSLVISVEDLRIAELKLLSVLQCDVFAADVESLKSKDKLLPGSKLENLDAFLDENGNLRVAGRLENLDVDESVKHPLILPSNDLVTYAIIRDCHASVGHCGRNATINELRNRGYHVLHVTSSVKRVIYDCVHCKKCRGKFGEQKMAQLPRERLENAPPFTYCGVDFAGPFFVKIGRRSEKRYLALFTDLVFRGNHIEVCHSLDTNSLICAFRRFVSRRGNVRYMKSDNGTNFTGFSNEMKKALKGLEPELRTYLLESGCDLEWSFNVPLASHAAGVWERQIGTMRRIFESLLRKHPNQLNDEGLRTLLAEVENIMNCRPLTVDNLSDPDSPTPLNPMSILTRKTKVVMPPFGNFDRSDLYSKQWRRVQHLANEIWQRFRKEYLSQLNSFAKWSKVKRNFEVGDIVLLKDDSVHRNEWPMGKIIRVKSDDGGLVRSVGIRMPRHDLRKKKTVLERPISKIILLVPTEIEVRN